MILSKNQYEYFVKRFRYWQNYFGLSDWTVLIQVEDKENTCDDSHVYVTLSLEDMRAWVIVAKEWDRVDRQFIDETACHEVQEVMFGEIEEIGNARYVRKGELRTAIHKVINRITRTLCKNE